MFVAKTAKGGAAKPGRGGSAAVDPAPVSSLSMYSDPPNEMLTLEDFEVYAFERLKLLKAIENAKSRGLKTGQVNEAIKETMKTTLGSLTDADSRRRDTVSHHILRLAYCQSEEQRRWYLQYECALFKYRAEREPPDRIAEFMDRYELKFTAATPEQKRAVIDELRAVWEAHPPMPADGEGGEAAAPPFSEREEFYRVPFTEALDLLRSRSVLLREGFAYVPRSRMVSALVARFRTYLSYSLIAANRFLPEVLRDERLKPMLENMSKTYTGPEYGAGRKSVEHVTAADVDELAASAFPLCMANMHASLKERHKLKHLGRLQYGLFLKGVGLPVEEALLFWQREFTKGMSADEFLKKYAYNIRYNYGKEGKRTDFSPYSCVKVILAPPPASDEVHGCPFKSWDVSQLRAAMGRMKLAPAAIDSVVEAVRGKEYQVACRRQFEGRFPGGDSGNVGNHPNAYAEAANAFVKQVAAAGAAAGAASPGQAGAAGVGAGAGVHSPASASPAAASAVFSPASVSPAGAASGAGAGSSSSGAMQVEG